MGKNGFAVMMLARVSLLCLAALFVSVLCLSAKGQGTPAGGISVDAFTDDARGSLKAGDVLHVTLQGTRSGKATFAIPGLAESVSMKEVTPGNYAGSYTIPKNVSVSGAAVVGRLSYPGIESPLVPAENRVTVDSVAPRILFVSPSKGATVETAHPLIYAALSDAGGVGVAPASVRIVIDGGDRTPQAAVTPFSVSLTPTLTFGTHTVAVAVSDLAGNSATAQWQFTVAPSQWTSSFRADAVPGQRVGVNQTIRFTLNAQTGGQGKVSIAGVVSDVPLGEGRPGVYTGEYTVRPGDDAVNVPVVALFRPAKGQTITVPLSAGLTLSAGPPQPPQITDPPVNDIEAGETLSLAGTAASGATVRVTLRYLSKATGGLLPISGVASVQEVTVEGKGNWRTDNISLRLNSLLGRSQSTAFTVSAVTVAFNGDVSAPANITVHRA